MSHYNYVEEVNSNLICCVCRAPFVDPVITTTCSHTFCRDCICKSLELQPCCPIDRSPLKEESLRPENLLVRNMVDELMVECAQRPMGCMHTCQRQHLQAHLQHSCQYVQVSCSEEGCDKTVLRKDLGRHTHDCVHRLVGCEGCGISIKTIELDAHNLECTAQDTSCPHCGEAISRAQLKEHQATCPEVPVPCQCAPYGCEWTGARRELGETHTPQCPYAAISSFFSVYEEQMTRMRDENALLRQHLERMETTLQGLRGEIGIARHALGPWWRSEGVDGGAAAQSQSRLPELEDGVEGITVTTTTSSTSTPRASVSSSQAPMTSYAFDPVSRRGASLSAIMASFPDSPVMGTESDDLEYERDPHSPMSHNPHADIPFAGPNYPRDPLLSMNAAHAGARSFPPALRFPEIPGISSRRPTHSTHSALHPSSTAVAPVDLSGTLEGALSSLRGSIVALSASIDSLGRRQDIALTTENLRMNEEVGALRAVVHGLRMQVHSLITERYGSPWFPSTNSGAYFPQLPSTHPPMTFNPSNSTGPATKL